MEDPKPRVTSPARIRANRENAKKSTGPRTARGKAISSRNALTHGLTAQTRFPPANHPAWFGALVADLFNRLRPEGAAEEFLVRRIAANQWRLARAIPLDAGIMSSLVANGQENIDTKRAWAQHDGDPDPYPKTGETDALGIGFIIDCAEAASLVKLARYEAALERSIDRCLRQLNALRMVHQAESAKNKNYETNPTPAGPMLK